MRGPAFTGFSAAVLAGVLCATTAWAQTSTPPQGTKPPPTSTEAPSRPQNIDRIRDAVNKPSTLVVTDGQLRIYVEVIGNWPTFAEYAKGYDFIIGAVPSRGAMSHSEFLNMVTPKELYGSGGISAGELLQGAIVNWLGQKIIKKGLKEISEARNAGEIAEIRARIAAELAALKGGK